MDKFPDAPFLTLDFSPKGGGLDFLGTRQVNYIILDEHLLPGINNATTDIGIYCLGAWIPWKFRQLCKTEKDFKQSNFKKFREALEIMIAHTIRDGSPSLNKLGSPNRRLGVQQEIIFPSVLSFKNVKRTSATSIYAAPLYGPSLHYVEFLAGYALSKEGRSTDILLTNEDAKTRLIVEEVDKNLYKSKHYENINQIEIPTLSSDIIDDLGNNGLNPAFYKHSDRKFKEAIIIKLIPNKRGPDYNARALTAKLLIETLRQESSLSSEEIRVAWYTGLTKSGKKLVFENPILLDHREKWSIFMARQYQRLILELFLWMFELALKSGCSSVEEIKDYSIENWKSTKEYPLPETFQEQLNMESKWLKHRANFRDISKIWNKLVHQDHLSFEKIEIRKESELCAVTCSVLARWLLRTYAWLKTYKHQELFVLGGPDRISHAWFIDWIMERKSNAIDQFLKEIISDLIFAQHIKVALSRFDGQTQRLRFVLGDRGIEPTRSVGNKLGKNPAFMMDRLDSFIRLLIDLSVINENHDEKLSIGENAELVLPEM